jgi:hypothetical protein
VIRLTDNHEQRLERMRLGRVLPALGEELEAAAESIVTTAQQNLNDGAISGPGHIPGPPGGYSNSDTHELEQSFHRGETIEMAGEVKSSTIADAPHAIYQELGTSKVQPRPNMQLATEEVRPTVIEALGARYIEIVNG